MPPFGPWPGRAGGGPAPPPVEVWFKHSALMSSNPASGITVAMADSSPLAFSGGARDLEGYAMPVGITLNSMRVALAFEWSGDAALTVMVRKNDVATALTVTFPTPSAAGTQLTIAAPVAFATGDLYSVVADTARDVSGPSDIGLTAIVVGVPT